MAKNIEFYGMEKINKRKLYTFIFMTIMFTAYFQYDKHFGGENTAIASAKELESSPFYEELIQDCKNSICCENSVKVMVKYGYKLSDGNCENGDDMLKCSDSLKWCKPVLEKK